MGFRSKAAQTGAAVREEDRAYPPLDALRLAQKSSPAKFDASVEVSMRLGVDPRKADQMVRGTVNLPNGTGKTARVIVFATGAQVDAAREAGDDEVGDDEMIERVAGGRSDFDEDVATSHLMSNISSLGLVCVQR